MASHSSNVQVSKVLMMLVSVLWFCNKYMIYPHHLTGICHTVFIVSKASPPLLHHHLLPLSCVPIIIIIILSVIIVTLTSDIFHIAHWLLSSSYLSSFYSSSSYSSSSHLLSSIPRLVVYLIPRLVVFVAVILISSTMYDLFLTGFSICFAVAA